MPATDPRVTLNGVKVYPFRSFKELLAFAMEHKGILISINAEKILHATPETRGIINRNIGYCDGIGAMYAMRQKGHPEACKLPGCELWLQTATTYYKEKTFYLVGGRQDVIDETVDKMKRQFPGIRIVGYRNGYLHTKEERKALIDDIAAKKPDIVFVAMGSPKQELLMEDMLHRHLAIYQGLGGSFDVYTGHVKRAPRWWIDHNMEFLYRLIKQPSRIKRQIHLIKFAYLLMLHKL
mgnify:CR=1 FL=1